MRARPPINAGLRDPMNGQVAEAIEALPALDTPALTDDLLPRPEELLDRLNQIVAHVHPLWWHSPAGQEYAPEPTPGLRGRGAALGAT